jgi:hypothetical protein
MAEDSKIVDTIDVGVDRYDIMDNWVNKIASKYMETDDVNHMKVGLFGYINEVLATSVRSSIAHRNFLYDETFLNTANMTKSIYNKAKSYNYDIETATPAKMKILLSLSQDDIVEYGEPEIDPITGGESGNYTFTLDAENKILLGNYQFMAEADIIIYAKFVEDEIVDGEVVSTYAYSAKYDYSKYINNRGIFSESSSPYISVWVDRDDNLADIITMEIEVYQIEKSSTVFENFSSDLSDNLIFNVEFDNQIAYFNVTYETQDTTTVLTKYFNDSYTPDDEYYCYYSFDTTTLTIYFSALADNFKPAINSTLLVDTYTTYGSGGVINYEGEIEYEFTDSSLSRVEYLIQAETSPSGGADTPTKLEIKQYLMQEFLRRDNLVTEYDLNTYFNSLVKEDLVNASNMLFIKKRDDVFKRCYSAFLLMKDKNGLILPTNTINFDYLHDVDSEFSIEAGSEICCDTSEYILLTDSVKYFLNSIADRLEDLLDEDDKKQEDETESEDIDDDEDEVEDVEDSDEELDEDEKTVGPLNEDVISPDYDIEGELLNDNIDDGDMSDLALSEEFIKEVEDTNDFLTNDDEEESDVDTTYVDRTFQIYQFIDDPDYDYIKYNSKFDELEFDSTNQYGDSVKISFREKLKEVNEDDTMDSDKTVVMEKVLYRSYDEENDADKTFELMYRLPFALYYKTYPFQRVLVVRNTIDFNLYFDYAYINSVISYEFILNSINIHRNSISFDQEVSTSTEATDDGGKVVQITTTNDVTKTTNEYVYNSRGQLIEGPTLVLEEEDYNLNKYKLSFTLSSTLSRSDVQKDPSVIIIRAFIKDSNGDYTGYFDFDNTDYLETNPYQYEKYLYTDDVIDDHNRLCLTNCVYSMEEEYNKNLSGIYTTSYIPSRDTKNEDEALEEYYIEENATLDIYIFIKNSVYTPVLDGKTGLMEDLVNNGYSTAVKLSSTGVNFSLFNILNDVMTPTLVYRPSKFVDQGVQIKQIPAIGSHYMMDYNIYKTFFDIFDTYYQVLVYNFQKLENNTSVDIKFYNTYGFAEHFSSYSTNITLNLTIKLATGFTSELDLNIKKYIVAFVEAVNETSNKVFAISNLMRGLEKTFTEIEYVELISLDDTNSQVVTSSNTDVDDMDQEQLINYIPEYINIDIKKEAYLSGDDDYKTGISITYI